MREHVMIELAAIVGHEVNRAYCASIGDFSQPPWEEVPERQRSCCRAGVYAIIGYPKMTSAEQHDEWCRFKREDGWTHGPVKDAAAKTHPCLKPYHELPKEQQVKDMLFGAAVRAVLGMKR